MVAATPAAKRHNPTWMLAVSGIFLIASVVFFVQGRWTAADAGVETTEFAAGLAPAVAAGATPIAASASEAATTAATAAGATAGGTGGPAAATKEPASPEK